MLSSGVTFFNWTESSFKKKVETKVQKLLDFFAGYYCKKRINHFCFKFILTTSASDGLYFKFSVNSVIEKVSGRSLIFASACLHDFIFSKF
jgi:hypothetical protein